MVALSSRMHETFKDKLHFYVVFEPLPKLFHFEIGRAFSHFVSTPEVFRLCEGLRVFDYIMEAETHTEQEISTFSPRKQSAVIRISAVFIVETARKRQP